MNPLSRWITTERTRLMRLPSGPLQRSLRIAISTTVAFVVADNIPDLKSTALFAVFGSLAFLLFANLGTGPRPQRALLHLIVVASTGALLALGTLCSGYAWLGAIVAAGLGVIILLTGMIGPAFAGITTPLLVSFVMGSTVPAPADQIPHRLAVWLLAGIVSVPAVLLPAPGRPDHALRQIAAATCHTLGSYLRFEGSNPTRHPDREERAATAVAQVGSLRATFYQQQYGAAGLGADERALLATIERILLLGTALERLLTDEPHPFASTSLRPVASAAADVLSRTGDLLVTNRISYEDLDASLRDLQAAAERVEREALALAATSADERHDIFTLLDPGFRARILILATTAIANEAKRSTTTHHERWWRHFLDRTHFLPQPPQSFVGWLQHLLVHLDRHAVWLQNSVRGALGLGIAVFVANTSGVDRAFWVAFGTLSVLRSTATNTGQSVIRALVGTIIGSAIGGLLITIVGAGSPAAWVLFVLGLAFTTLAPAVVSFAAGQAGFSVTVIMLFSLVAPISWSISLVRIEDVAIGCGVALLMSLLFWPRGASSALGAALSEAVFEASRYLSDSTRFALAQCAHRSDETPERPDGYRAAAATRRLDDAFRQFLSERGTKRITVAQVTTLITATQVVRDVADDICRLWKRPDVPLPEDLIAIRTEILQTEEAIAGWFTDLALSLVGFARVPLAPGADGIAGEAEQRLDLVRRDLTRDGRSGSPTAAKLVWTFDYLTTIQRLEAEVLRTAQGTVAALRPRTARELLGGA